MKDPLPRHSVDPRVSKAEWELLQQAAAKDGRSVPNFFRHYALMHAREIVNKPTLFEVKNAR